MLVVAEAALAGHLEHGDHLGECEVVEPRPAPRPEEKVEVCLAPGTPAQKTLLVAADAVEAHLADGDYSGPCAEDEPDGAKPAKPDWGESTSLQAGQGAQALGKE
jgi:hypothetical protein